MITIFNIVQSNKYNQETNKIKDSKPIDHWFISTWANKTTRTSLLNTGTIIKGCRPCVSRCRKTVTIELTTIKYQIIIETSWSRPCIEGTSVRARLRTTLCRSRISCLISLGPARTAPTTPSAEPSCSCSMAEASRAASITRKVIIICLIKTNHRQCISKIGNSRWKLAAFQRTFKQRIPKVPRWFAVWFLRSRTDPEAPARHWTSAKITHRACNSRELITPKTTNNIKQNKIIHCIRCGTGRSIPICMRYHKDSKRE